MAAPEVYSLPTDDLDPFLDRRRYSVFSLTQLQFSSFLSEILIKANDFVPSSAGSILMDRPFERGETPADTLLYFVAAFGHAAADLLGQSLRADRGVVGYVYRTGESYLMSNPNSDPNFYSKFDERHEFHTFGSDRRADSDRTHGVRGARAGEPAGRIRPSPIAISSCSRYSLAIPRCPSRTCSTPNAPTRWRGGTT